MKKKINNRDGRPHRKAADLEIQNFEKIMHSVNKIFEHKIVNIFLPISFSVCFGCSKEPSH